MQQLYFSQEASHDVEDFVSAFFASLTSIEGLDQIESRTLLVSDLEAWNHFSRNRIPHMLVADPRLDITGSEQQAFMRAKKAGHFLIIPIERNWNPRDQVIRLRNPSAHIIQRNLEENGFAPERARELGQAGANSLAALKRSLMGSGNAPPYSEWTNARDLALATLFGIWRDNSPGDRAAIEGFLGNSYGEWIERIRRDSLRSDAPLIERNGLWRIVNRAESWNALGPRITDGDLESFKQLAITVLCECDPKFDLPEEDRFAAAIYGKIPTYSQQLRDGIAETLALLGARAKSLSSCNPGHSYYVADSVVGELLSASDWRDWASLDHFLPLLAEASPDVFLDCVSRMVESSEITPELFKQEGSAVMGWNYTSGLLWALETLAWNADYLAPVCQILGMLAAIDPGGNWGNRPKNSLTDIFLPWHQQTSADLDTRVAAIRTLMREQRIVAWKLIQSLLPDSHMSTSGCRKPIWRDFVPADWREGFTNREYFLAISEYVRLAVELATGDAMLLAELIGNLPSITPDAFDQICDHLKSSQILSLSEAERLPIWEALSDLVQKHRKFPDANWSMKEDRLPRLEDIIERIKPVSPLDYGRRWFSDRDFELYDGRGEYEEQHARLEERRAAIIADLVEASGVDSLRDLLLHIASPQAAGRAASKLAVLGLDSTLLPHWLREESAVPSAFMRGYIQDRLERASWDWISGLNIEAWSLDERLRFCILLPFEDRAFELASRMLGDKEGAYWEKVSVPYYLESESAEFAAEKLAGAARPAAALQMIYSIHLRTKRIPAGLTLRLFLELLKIPDQIPALNVHDLAELIGALQDSPGLDQMALCSIESAFLPLLDHEGGRRPKTLEKQLASNPSFYCEAIRLAYKSDSGESTAPSEEAKRLASTVYRLFMQWRTVPGTSASGEFSPDDFTAWLGEVNRIAKESNHLRSALRTLGKVLPYASADPGGLWIHDAIAKSLNSKDAEEMREGFATELFNMRGVFRPTGGAEERKIAAGYYEKARQLTKAGYTRFAMQMREVATRYERDAECEEKRAQDEDYS